MLSLFLILVSAEAPSAWAEGKESSHNLMIDYQSKALPWPRELKHMDGSVGKRARMLK